MSKLFYDIPLVEEFYDSPEAMMAKLPARTVHVNIPHKKELEEWITSEWNGMHMEQYFDGILKDKVESCIMRPFTIKENGDELSFGRVEVTFVKGFRLTDKRRIECWDQLDAQMTDGFGETFDAHQIPGAPEGWCIQF